jgi:hypothetical protein
VWWESIEFSGEQEMLHSEISPNHCLRRRIDSQQLSWGIPKKDLGADLLSTLFPTAADGLSSLVVRPSNKSLPRRHQ